MGSISAQSQRVKKLLAQVKPAPLPPGRIPGIEYLSDGELADMQCWGEIEAALSKDDTALSEKLRRRQGVTFEQLTDRFLNLDLSALPTDCNAPGAQVQEGKMFYSMTYINYRYTRMMVECGKAETYKLDIWRWIDFIEESRTSHE